MTWSCTVRSFCQMMKWRIWWIPSTWNWAWHQKPVCDGAALSWVSRDTEKPKIPLETNNQGGVSPRGLFRFRKIGRKKQLQDRSRSCLKKGDKFFFQQHEMWWFSLKPGHAWIGFLAIWICRVPSDGCSPWVQNTPGVALSVKDSNPRQNLFGEQYAWSRCLLWW